MNRRAWIFALALLALMPLSPKAALARAEPLYRAPASPWIGAISGALNLEQDASPLPPSLTLLASPALTSASFAPLVAQLQRQLKLTPGAFLALPLEERRINLELAVEAARGELTQTAAQLTAQAHALSSPDKALDKEGRAELYRVVVQLDELRRYGALLHHGELEVVAASYERASLRAWAIRNALLGLDDAAAALNEAGDQAAVSLVERQKLLLSRPLPAVSRGTLDLADAMRHNVVGWKLRDLENLLVGYGFKLDTRDSKHRKYEFEFSGVKSQVVPHSRDVDPQYIRSALAAISKIEILRAQRAQAADVPVPAPAPAQINLDELAVLLADKPQKPATKAKKTTAAPPAAAAPVETESNATANPARLKPAAPRDPKPKIEPPPTAEMEQPRSRLQSIWGRIVGPSKPKK